MYCRQQRYPSPRLISYKIPGIRVLWGFGVTLSKVSTLAAQRPDLGHYVISRNPPPWRTFNTASHPGLFTLKVSATSATSLPVSITLLTWRVTGQLSAAARQW